MLSTLLANTIIQVINNHQIDKKIVSLIMGTDLSRAFGLLDTDMFCRKLDFYNIHPQSIQLIHSYLSRRKSLVKLQDYNCVILPNKKCGLVQGSKLRGLFFNISSNKTTKLNNIMNNRHIHRRTTNQDIHDNEIEHETVNHIDDSHNKIAGNSIKEIEGCI